jgi:oligopeptide/dipeptide ABC transporter ATP-binding protein
LNGRAPSQLEVGPSTGSGILEVDGLTVEFRTENGRVVVVEDVGFHLERGRTLGLVGESGSGKTVTALSILGLIPRNARVKRGVVSLEGRDLLGLPEAAMREVRGAEVAMIFQEPRRSLDPSFSVGDQIAEVARRHLHIPKAEAQRKAVEMLERVRIPNAQRRAGEYPHMFSGGMCQRVMLAMALVASPKVLIADEPTTALDVTVQARVLELLRELQRDLGLAILFITHDLGVIAEMCDRVAVMYAGQIVETAPVEEIFKSPQHPYTEGLLSALPQRESHMSRLSAIPGTVPSADAWPAGCRFHTRCAYADARCSNSPPMMHIQSPGHGTRCLRAEELTLRGVSS